MTNCGTRLRLLAGLCSVILLIGCGGEKSNPLSAFQPEIINTADAFQFQVTDASDVTTTVTYAWTNTGAQATVNHSTVTTAGSATVFILDADSTQVYTAGLAASLNESSAAGTAGVWTVRVVFVDFSGTANFRVEKL